MSACKLDIPVEELSPPYVFTLPTLFGGFCNEPGYVEEASKLRDELNAKSKKSAQERMREQLVTDHNRCMHCKQREINNEIRKELMDLRKEVSFLKTKVAEAENKRWW